MGRHSLSEILEWTGGQLVNSKLYALEMIFEGVSTDTRELEPGCLFIALRGSNHDGHAFLDKAVSAGAAGLIIDMKAELDETLADYDSGPVIVVEDTLKALQDIAAGYRKTLPGRVIAITGSVGKTSTRQMVAACLSGSMPVHLTSGNLNNEIGLPQTILQADRNHRAIILEMGMRGLGEISLLSRLAKPDTAMITNIGLSHVGRLGSREAILSAKTEITDGLRPGGLLILNADDPMLKNWGLVQPGSFRLVWVTTDPAMGQELSNDAAFVISAENICTMNRLLEFKVNLHQAGQIRTSANVRLPFPGRHHVHNALFGLACAWDMDISPEIAAADAVDYQHAGNRQRLIEAGEVLLMDDSYNASPESMQAALGTLAEMSGDRRLAAVLGGMLELGEFSAAAHRELGRQAAEYGFSVLFLIGPNAIDVAAGAHELSPELPAYVFDDNQTLIKALAEWLSAGDCLLIKGSRGFAMEKVTEAIVEHLSSLEIRP